MSGRLVGLVALIIGVIAGCAEYYWGDHWLYVNGGEKYLYPSAWANAAFSAVVGAVTAGSVWVSLALALWRWRRMKPKRAS
jgi:hypothetical protein